MNGIAKSPGAILLGVLIGVTISHISFMKGIQPMEIIGIEQTMPLENTSPPPIKTGESAIVSSDSGSQRSFYDIGLKYHTDKVAAKTKLPTCLEHPETCTRKNCTKEECRPWGHFYQTMYQQRFGHLSLNSTAPFQFLEIGYYNGGGFDTYTDFFPTAELHSMEISCLPEGPREEGKWPWGNFAAKNKHYQELLDANRLHCGDAFSVEFLNKTWTTHMKRPDAPPLKVVVDDGAHLAAHMAQSVFYWFPRIEPGGLLVVEDVQPIEEANLFRTQFLPQIMNDLHFCGDPKQPEDAPCFPTLQPLLQSIHCEMHICVFERNAKPASDPSLEDSTMPPGALDLTTCNALSKPFGRSSG